MTQRTAGAAGDVRDVDGESVGEIEHRVRSSRELQTLVDTKGRPDVALLAKGRAGAAERAGDDEQVAWSCTRTPRHALGPAERCDRHEHDR